MGDKRTDQDILALYICGQCGYPIEATNPGEEPPVPCPECTWPHRDRPKYSSVPSEIKLDLKNY